MTECTLHSDYASVIAIDQHARSVTMSAIDFAAGESRSGRLAGCPTSADIVKWVSWMTPPMRFVYENSQFLRLCIKEHSCDPRRRAGWPSRTVMPTSALLSEGFFGRLKVEFFYGCDWREVTIEEFMGMLDSYLRWYRDVRIKSDLGYKSPMQYRRDLGLAA